MPNFLIQNQIHHKIFSSKLMSWMCSFACWNFSLYLCYFIPSGLEITFGHWPFSDQFYSFGWVNPFSLLDQIYCTFLMGKPLLVYSNVTACKKWLTNFKLLFQVLACAHALLAKSKWISKKKLLWLCNKLLSYCMWCYY